MDTTNCDLSVLPIQRTSLHSMSATRLPFNVTIRNNSVNGSVVPVRVDVYYNAASQPAASVPGDAFGYLPAMGPKQFCYLHFSRLQARKRAGTWHTWFRVDRLNEIAETNETNNGTASLTITWNPLPPVPTPTISFDAFTETFNLTWTYPLTVNGFNIYRSDNPSGPFTTQIGTTTDSFYSDLEAGDKQFYQVKAYKTWP